MKGERGGRCEGIFLRQVYDKGRERKREMRERVVGQGDSKEEREGSTVF